MKAHSLDLPPLIEGMSPHNPLYDAAVAEVAWRHLMTALADSRRAAERAHPF